MLASVDWSAWTAVFTGLLTVGVAVTAVQIYDTRRTSRAEMARELGRRWSSPEMVEARKLINSFKMDTDLEKAVLWANSQGTPDLYVYIRFLDFFEELGVVATEAPGALRTIDSLIGTQVLQSWDLWRPIVEKAWPDQVDAARYFRLLAERVEERRSLGWGKFPRPGP